MESSEIVRNPLIFDQLDTLLKSLRTTIANSYVPVKNDGNVRPLDEDDFKDYLLCVECNLVEISDNSRQLNDVVHSVSVPVDFFSNIGTELVVPLILLCGEHRKRALWTNGNTIIVTDQILQLLCKLCGCTEARDILLEGSSFGGKKFGPFLKTCLLLLRPKLLKDTWKTFPAAVASYQWILFQVKAQHLSDYINIVLPTSLIIVDDFQTENQLCGVSCLQHIVENMTRAELGWYGQGDVVLEALQRLLYEREPALVKPLVSCIVLVLDKLERGHLATSKDNSWSRFDDVLEVVLKNMEMESRSEMRKAYIESLPHLLEAARVNAVRWSRRLLRILKDYLEVAGQAERGTAISALQALETYMMLAHPRLRHHANAIFLMLLRLLYDVAVATHVRDSSDEQLVTKSVEDCLNVLVQSAPEEARKVAVELRTQARFNEKFAAVLDSVFMPFCK